MRKFLMTVFWLTNIGSVIQLLVIVAASWIIFSGDYAFFDLDVNAFITQYVPWLLWLKNLLIAVFGELGYWVLALPVLIIAPLKLIGGTFIGVWAYTTAKNMPARELA